MNLHNKLNKKGMSFIEVLFVIFLLLFLVSGFAGFYKFLNNLDRINSLKSIDHSFVIIQDIIKNKSCNSFIGKKFEKDISIFAIKDANGLDIYKSMSHPSFNEKNNSIGDDVFIQKMTLKHSYLNFKNSSIFEIKYIHSDNQIQTKKVHIPITVNNNKIIRNCFSDTCKSQYIMPQGSVFFPNCNDVIKDEIKEAEKWVVDNPAVSFHSKSKAISPPPPIIFYFIYLN